MRALLILAAIALAAGCADAPSGLSTPHGAGWEDETDLGVMKAASSGCSTVPAKVPEGSPRGSSYVNDGLPPVRFQGNATFVVQTHSPAEVDRICAPVPRPCGVTYYACTFGRHVDLPNPCDPQFAGERFALTVCHEAAHVSGWPASHGE